MIRFFFIIVALSSTAFSQTISQDSLNSLITNGSPYDFVLIDIRGANASDNMDSMIGSQLCKPYNLVWPTQFQQEYTRLAKDQAIIIYCASGGRASSALSFLQQQGYTNVKSAGGIGSWKGTKISKSECLSVDMLPAPSMTGSTPVITRKNAVSAPSFVTRHVLNCNPKKFQRVIVVSQKGSYELSGRRTLSTK